MPPQVHSDPDSEAERCNECGHARWWQRIGSDAWKCEVCLPPPTESFVECRQGTGVEQKPKVVEELTLQALMPVCTACMCQIYSETVYSDGTVEKRCVRPGCRAEVTGEPVRVPEVQSRGYCTTASTSAADRQAMAERFQRWQQALGTFF